MRLFAVKPPFRWSELAALDYTGSGKELRVLVNSDGLGICGEADGIRQYGRRFCLLIYFEQLNNDDKPPLQSVTLE